MSLLNSTQAKPLFLKTLRPAKADLYLLLEFITLALCIIAGAIFNPDGFLSPDSTSYLALAQNLVAGKGFSVSGYGFSGLDQDFFAIWPAGYPLLIALVAKLSGISVFWSSKILNILLAGLSLLVFRKIFLSNAYVYGLLFLFGSSILIYSFTWSETLFIFALIGYATAIAIIIQSKEASIKDSVFIGLFSLLLFMTKYLGAFSIISTGGLGLYYLLKKTDRKKGSILIITACINASIVIAYLYNNLLLTGQLTGIPRIPSPESNIELLTQLAIAVISELIIPIPYLFLIPAFFGVVIIQIICFIFCFNNKKTATSIEPKQYCTYALAFFNVGMLYLICLVIMRWLSYFDDFYFRLLTPGFLLIFTALIRHTEINFPARFQQLAKALIVMVSLTVITIPVLLIVSPQQPTYAETVREIQKKYSGIESGSVVAFGNMHLKYLRNDIQLWSPFSLPYNNQAMAFKTMDLTHLPDEIPLWSPPLLPYNDKQESWENFLSRAGKNKNIYIAVPVSIDENIYHESVVAVIKQYPENTLARIQ